MPYVVTNPSVVAVAFQGAMAGIASNNRQQPFNEPITDEEDIFGVLAQPVIAYQIVAAAFAVAVDQAFEEIGGFPDEGGQLELVQGLSRGVWVNRGSLFPINLIPDNEEDLENFLETVGAETNPASDPATYLPVARSLIVPSTIAGEVLEELTGVDLSETDVPPLFTFAGNYAAGGGGNIANGSTATVATCAFTIPEGYQAKRVMMMISMGLSNPTGVDVRAVLDIDDATYFGATSQNKFQDVPAGVVSSLSLFALSTQALGPGNYSFPITINANGAVGGQVASNALVGVMVQQVPDSAGP